MSNIYSSRSKTIDTLHRSDIDTKDKHTSAGGMPCIYDTASSLSIERLGRFRHTTQLSRAYKGSFGDLTVRAVGKVAKFEVGKLPVLS